MPKRINYEIGWTPRTTLLMAIFIFLLAVYIFLVYQRQQQQASLMLQIQQAEQSLLHQSLQRAPGVTKPTAPKK